MSYASKQDMIDRFGNDELIQLTDRATPPTGVIDDVVLNAAIADSDDEINSYLQARYSLPLATVPLLIKKLARTIARYNLYDDLPPEHVENQYKAAINTLKGIARGEQKLGLDAQNKPTVQSNIPEMSGPERIFDRSKLADY